MIIIGDVVRLRANIQWFEQLLAKQNAVAHTAL